MRIVLILGPICSGKSTYINQHFTTDDAVVVRIGKFLRESIGLSAMAKDPSPNVCFVTENWVRLHVEGALRCAHALDRPVVFDGYPRSAAQVQFLKEAVSKIMSLNDVELEIVVLETPREEIVRRIEARADGDKQAAAFDRMRLEASQIDLEAITSLLSNTFPLWVMRRLKEYTGGN